VHERLRTSIVAGTLPPGSHLSVPELARRLGVSRSPVRDALLRLERTGLVSLVPRRGAVVLNPDADDLAQLFEIREALEGTAARLAAERMTDHERTGLAALVAEHSDAVAAGDQRRHVELDLAFHASIRAGTRNRRLVDSLDLLSDQIELAIYANAARRWSVDRALREHRAIVDAITRRDADAAESAARTHIARVKQTLLGALPATT
jgi:DNA-binding GntR family transcriptional regulator